MNAKERARKLIQMDANGSLDKYKQDAISEGRMTFSSGEDGGVVNTTIMEHSNNDLNQYNNVVNVAKEVLGDFEQLKKEANLNGVKVKENKDSYSLIGDFDDIDFLLNVLGISLDEVLGYEKGE